MTEHEDPMNHDENKQRVLTAANLAALGVAEHEWDVFAQLLSQALHSFSVLIDGAQLLLEHDLLRGGCTNHPCQPAQMRRAPTRTAFVADILSQQERLQPILAGLQIPHRIFAGA